MATTRRRFPWSRYSDKKLLDMRICDLGLTIEGSELESRVQQLFRELKRKDLSFRPHCWLSTEWFAPNHVPGIAIPFYLAHPRLTRLEDTMMLEVEGGSREWCMQLLRHEAGHAYETAFALGRRRKWRRAFGKASKPYPEHYRPKPVSRKYVLHLDWWYAQSHPCEDFAETFAVWLTPGLEWEEAYEDWPALKKLRYVDELMTELREQKPIVHSRKKVDAVRSIRMTLREYYDTKQQRYGSEYPDFYDEDLRRLFPDPSDPATAPAAAAYLRKLAPEMRRIVRRWTGEYNYTVDLVLKDMIRRCRELDLRVGQSEAEVRVELAAMLTMHTMNFVYGTDHEVPV